MSKREDIIDGSLAESAKYGLVYTELCGWIDLGHANPVGGADKLWSNVMATQMPHKALGPPVTRGLGPPVTRGLGPPIAGLSGSESVEYSQLMGNRHIKIGIKKNFYIKNNLTLPELRSVALSIFMDVSLSFEGMQESLSWITDSGFSAEDLVSNLISFYRAVLPRNDYVSRCQPVSIEDARKIWDSYDAVGQHKNKSFNPILFAKVDAKSGKREKRVGRLPDFLTQIIPAPKGTLYKSKP